MHIVADKSSRLTAGHHRHSTAPIVSRASPAACRHMTLNQRQTFHNEEAGDIVSWLTRSTAASGGRCIIASCHTVYNVLANERPDLVRALAGSDWPFFM